MLKKRIFYKDLVGYDKKIFDLDRASSNVGVPSRAFESIIDEDYNFLNNKDSKAYFSILKRLIKETKCDKSDLVLSFFDRFLFATDYCDTCFDKNGFEARFENDDFLYVSKFNIEDGRVSSLVKFGDEITSEICFSRNLDGVLVTLNDSRINALKLVDTSGVNRFNLSEEFHYLDYDKNFVQVARGDIISRERFSTDKNGCRDKVYSTSKDSTYFWRENGFILKKHVLDDACASYFIGLDEFDKEIDVDTLFYPIDREHVDLFLNKEIDTQGLWDLTKKGFSRNK